jgi:hypothetical protein
LHAAEVGRPKSIEIITGFAPSELLGHQERAIENTAKDLFHNFGVALSVRREPGLHDRFVVLDNGVLFKLGRGLDIYKPAIGLAAHRPASRKVRQTEIDVFVLPTHPWQRPNVPRLRSVDYPCFARVRQGPGCHHGQSKGGQRTLKFETACR